MSIDTIRQAVQAEINKLQKILALLGAETGHGRSVSVQKAVTVETPKRRWSAARGRIRNSSVWLRFGAS